MKTFVHQFDEHSLNGNKRNVTKGGGGAIDSPAPNSVLHKSLEFVHSGFNFLIWETFLFKLRSSFRFMIIVITGRCIKFASMQLLYWGASIIRV